MTQATAAGSQHGLKNDPAAARRGPLGRWRTRRRNRVTRWDRPPEPRDWRFFVGHLGRSLITLGLLLFGFVGYQLWGTGIETARAQNQLETTFEAALTVNDAPAPNTDTTVPQDAIEMRPGIPIGATGVDDIIEPVDEAIEQVQSAAEQDLPPVIPGQAIFRLDMPTIGAPEQYVLPGIDREDLKQGPGHFPDTPQPGQLGNVALAGHRTTYGAPFNEVDEFGPGQQITVTRLDGNQYVYEYVDTIIVEPSDYFVVTTTDPNRALLTLTTCHPETTAALRMAVTFELVPELSSPVGEPTFYDWDSARLAPPASDDPTFVTATTTPATTAPATTTPATTTPGATPATTVTSTPATTATATTLAPAPQTGVSPPSEHVDAFNEGWFDDPDAWPQIALWGGLLAAVAITIYLISRRLRSYPIGWVVGVTPFLVSLYFFYQNLNRLLPAGL